MGSSSLQRAWFSLKSIQSTSSRGSFTSGRQSLETYSFTVLKSQDKSHSHLPLVSQFSFSACVDIINLVFAGCPACRVVATRTTRCICCFLFCFSLRKVCRVFGSTRVGGAEREREIGRERGATVVADYDMHSPHCFVMWMDSIR